jgi:hypothetical protein
MLAKFIIDQFIVTGSWHMFTEQEFISLVERVSLLTGCDSVMNSNADRSEIYGSIRDQIRSIHGKPTESFLSLLKSAHPNRFDVSQTIYQNEETHVYLKCVKDDCKKVFNILPRKALNPQFQCLECYVKRNYSYLRGGREESSGAYAKITDKLFLGDINSILDEKFLIGSKIKAVIDLSGSTSTPRTIRNLGLEHYKIKVDDNVHAKISPYFDKCYEFIHKWSVERNKTVLVFCRAGVSRSASVVISWLMGRCLATFDEAYNYVKMRRGKIMPNRGFVSQLKEFELSIV